MNKDGILGNIRQQLYFSLSSCKYPRNPSNLLVYVHGRIFSKICRLLSYRKVTDFGFLWKWILSRMKSHGIQFRKPVVCGT